MMSENQQAIQVFTEMKELCDEVIQAYKSNNDERIIFTLKIFLNRINELDKYI